MFAAVQSFQQILVPVSWRVDRSVLSGLFIVCVAIGVCSVFAGRVLAGEVEPATSRGDVPRYGRDIRPLLSDRCFSCHGPDKSSRKGRLRLDEEASAKRRAIVSGDAAGSRLVERLRTEDADELMPPPDSGKQLSAEDIALIERWIDAGAEYEAHWSFTPVVRPVPPSLQGLPDLSASSPPWAAIDRFVEARWQAAGLEASPLADPSTLARRVALDVTGLPLERERLDAFLASPDLAAYGALVDELLASEHRGEHLARLWLDAARYSDTDGYQQDATRSNWPWRDWVIDAYNLNLPFDQFTLEQFAGDLLPDARPDQVLATCFHRNHMTNGEGGRDPEESRVEYVIDRVNTIGMVWQGMTWGCSQCHDHKFDPLRQEEYYALAAYFDSIDEDGRAGGGAKPYLKVRSDKVEAGLRDAIAWRDSQKARYSAVREEASHRFDDWLQAFDGRAASTGAGVDRPHRSWHGWTAVRARTTGGSTIEPREAGELIVSGENPRHDDYVIAFRPELRRVTGLRLTVLPDAVHSRGGLSMAADGHVILTNLKISISTAGDRQMRELDVRSAIADYQRGASGKNYGKVRDVLDDDPRTGWSTEGSDVREARIAVFELDHPWIVDPAADLVLELRHRSLRGQSSMRRFRVEWTDERGGIFRKVGASPLERWFSGSAATQDRSDGTRKELLEQYLADESAVVEGRRELDRAAARVRVYEKAQGDISVMVLAERDEPRDTRVLVRGIWDQKGEPVRRGTPEAFPSLESGAPEDRAELARWLTSAENPLTARVVVNRYWQMFFGEGLVRTPEDFGLQGEPPTHPLLLDWLAAEFVEGGWDLRRVQKLILLSETYRRSSHATVEQRRIDPENRLLARGARFRRASPTIRDAALAVSGLLDRRIGGPPVYPYQPDGLWADSTMGRFHYQHSVGKDLYRRSLYSFWRRSVGPAAFFDAPKRRVCQVRVTRTNTPMHALTLMNDRTFVEAARVLAERLLAEGADSGSVPRDIDRLTSAFIAVLSRAPEARELEVLQTQLDGARAVFRRARGEAERLLAVGQAEVDPSIDPVEVAALSTVVMTLFNLDEFITHN